MLSITLLKTLNRIGIHYSWFMALLAFLALFFSSAAMGTPGILMVPITEGFGWTVSDFSISLSLLFVSIALAAPFGTALMHVLGLTKVIIISSALIIAGFLLTIISYEKWHFLFSIGICLGLASGVLGVGFAATVATRWFDARRGLVIGILASAWAAGQLILLPLIAWISETFGWQYGILPTSLGCLLSIILFLLFGKNWPSDLNLKPFGGEENSKNFLIEQSGNPIKMSFEVLRSSVRHPGFWILSLTFFICGLTSNGLISQHFVAFCSDINIGIVVASSYLALMGVFNFLGATSSGWLADRIDNYKLLAFYYAFRGLSLIYLPYSSLDVFSLTLWAIFFGFDFIATIPPTARFSAKFFGRINGPIAFSWMFCIHQLGAASAAFSAGEARDVILSYGPVFVTAGLMCFIATLSLLLFKISAKSDLSYTE